MKLLQKSLLILIISLVFFDLLSQLSSLLQLFSEASITVAALVSRLSFPIAFSLGCLIANYNLFKQSKLVSIIFSCYFIALIIGSYLYISDLKILSGLRFIHGYFLSLTFCKAFSMLNFLTPRIIFKDSLRRYGMFLSAATIMLLTTSSLITEFFGIKWFYIISMFLYFFTGTVMLLLFEYLKDIGRVKSKITSFDYKLVVKSPKISINFITIFLTALAIGALTYWSAVVAPNQQSLYFSSHVLLSTMIFSVCIVFATKLSLLSHVIGYIKVYTAGFLLIALSLSSIVILDGYIFLHIPYMLFGIGIGILINSCYQSLKEVTNYPVDDIAFGIFHSSMSIGTIAGIMLSSLITSYHQSPIIFICLIIISSSIFYIRQIHQKDRGFTISS